MQTVLLIDDSATFLRLLEKGMKDRLEIIGTARNGEAGFQMYKEKKPDLVLLDITMPDMNGKECLKAIMGYDAQAKVVMVSSLGDETTVAECLGLGAKAFVNKDDISMANIATDGPLSRTINSVLTREAA